MGNRTSVNQNIFSSIGFLNIENRVRQLRLNHVHNFFYNKINPHKNKTITRFPTTVFRQNVFDP
jgi:hypothetical protein